MSTPSAWRAILRAAGIFAPIVVFLGFASWVQPHGFRAYAADPPSVAKDKKPEPGALKPEEKRRDYAVLETALIDLTDPKSPINANAISSGHIGKYLILCPTTSPTVGRLRREFLPTVIDKEKGQRIPDEIADDLRRRNPGPPVSLNDLRTHKAPIRVRDVHAEFEGAGEEFFDKYWKKYPDSWSCVSAYLPGYSQDGKTAVVVFDVDSMPHITQVIYLLVNSGADWKIQWRNHHFWR